MFGWTKEWYRGPCALCGALVAVKSAFLSCAYMTCNMVSVHAHSRDELRRYWETRVYSREPYGNLPLTEGEWRRPV
jgi:hypothetical protein